MVTSKFIHNSLIIFCVKWENDVVVLQSVGIALVKVANNNNFFVLLMI